MANHCFWEIPSTNKSAFPRCALSKGSPTTVLPRQSTAFADCVSAFPAMSGKIADSEAAYGTITASGVGTPGDFVTTIAMLSALPSLTLCHTRSRSTHAHCILCGKQITTTTQTVSLNLMQQKFTSWLCGLVRAKHNDKITFRNGTVRIASLSGRGAHIKVPS